MQSKYHIKLSYKVDGLVERDDVIGAIFGYTGELLGDLNLHKLQKESRMGRMNLTLRSNTDTTRGRLMIPVYADIDSCSLIAATLESIDRVGPFACKFRLDSLINLYKR